MIYSISYITLIGSKQIEIYEKFSKNILIYSISYITLIGSKQLRIRFDKIDGFIKVHSRTRYLVLFGPKKYDAIYNRIKYLISWKVVYMLFLIIMQEKKLIHMIDFGKSIVKILI